MAGRAPATIELANRPAAGLLAASGLLREPPTGRGGQPTETAAETFSCLEAVDPLEGLSGREVGQGAVLGKTFGETPAELCHLRIALAEGARGAYAHR